MRVIFVSIAAGMLSTSAWGDSITIGLPKTSINIVPFGRLPTTNACTRYQQAYAAADFTGSNSISISSINFLGGNGGNFAPGTYNLYFSTITAGIDTLSNTSFDSNLGGDNALFISEYLSGASPTNLTFSGTPFLYNPAAGNLLLDMIISQDGPQPSGRIAGYELNGNAPGVFSRYDNFAHGNIGLGLVTEFDFVTVPEPSATNLVALALVIGTLLRFQRRARRDATHCDFELRILGYITASLSNALQTAWASVCPLQTAGHRSRHTQCR